MYRSNGNQHTEACDLTEYSWMCPSGGKIKSESLFEDEPYRNMDMASIILSFDPYASCQDEGKAHSLSSIPWVCIL